MQPLVEMGISLRKATGGTGEHSALPSATAACHRESKTVFNFPQKVHAYPLKSGAILSH